MLNHITLVISANTAISATVNSSLYEYVERWQSDLFVMTKVVSSWDKHDIFTRMTRTKTVKAFSDSSCWLFIDPGKIISVVTGIDTFDSKCDLDDFKTCLAEFLRTIFIS